MLCATCESSQQAPLAVTPYLALAEDSTVFSWSYAAAGVNRALGTQVKKSKCPDDRRFALSGLQVCALAAGRRRSCAVTASGELFTRSYGGGGLLEHGNFIAQCWCRRCRGLPGEMHLWSRSFQLPSPTMGKPLPSRATAACSIDR